MAFRQDGFPIKNKSQEGLLNDSKTLFSLVSFSSELVQIRSVRIEEEIRTQSCFCAGLGIPPFGNLESDKLRRGK